MRISPASVFSLCLAALMLAGCQIFSGPGFMPTWYQYHQGTYKAPPGPESSAIGYEPGLAANENVMSRWHVAAASLVEGLARTGIVPQPLYVEPLRRKNAFNGAYDYALREALRARGYMLATHPADAPLLRYEAFWTGDKTLIADSLPPDDLHEKGGDVDVILVLSIVENETVVERFSQRTRVPVYGFERGYSHYTKIYEPEPPPQYQQ